MKFLLIYEWSEALPDVASEHLPRHSDLIRKFHTDDDLVMVGQTGVPASGAMAVFTTSDAAERFVEADPFISAGAVRQWRIEQWDEVLVRR